MVFALQRNGGANCLLQFHGLLLVLLAFMALPIQASAGGPFRSAPQIILDDIGQLASSDEAVQGENHRAVAIALAVLLGPFGAHRLYLGTSPKVAIVYGLTFGGFGVLVLIDLVHLLVNKDLDRFRNNGQVLMWTGETTPP